MSVVWSFVCPCGREHERRRPHVVPAHMLDDLRCLLRGDVHGRIQTLRGMCSDEEPHTVLDRGLRDLDELVLVAIGDMEPLVSPGRSQP